jgi:hypothetical protein
MPSKIKNLTPPSPLVSEADFDDTIARNRALALLDPATVPTPPTAYRPTDPDVRNRRLRRLSSELRAEAGEALREAAKRDLAADLGKYAPDPARAPALLERMTTTGQFVTAVQTLLAYARELDQIAMSDVLVFLEAENKQLVHSLQHEPALAPRYTALQQLFASRAGAIAEGMARAKDEAAAEKPQPPREPQPPN